MDEINKNKIAEIIGLKEKFKGIEKKVAIIKDKRQCSIRIPKKFTELIDINDKQDKFQFTLKKENGKFILEGKLLQNDR